MALTKAQLAENKELQRALNDFFTRRLYGVAPLIVDGKIGQMTDQRVRRAKFYLGYTKKTAPSTRHPGAAFLKRLAHPNQKVGGATDASIKRGQERRIHQRKLAKAQEARLANAKGFGTFEGHTVPAWMVPILKKTRAYDGPLGKWQGGVVSGVRTPEYSEHLCYSRCGHPTCPGTCAGRGSNHNMEKSQGKPHGALDVSDYIRFGKIQQAIGSPLINRLPNDRVHYSVSGR